MNNKIFTISDGFGGNLFSLKYTNINFEVIGWLELNKSSINSHNILFPELSNKHFTDISYDELEIMNDMDVLYYTFPYRDIVSDNGHFNFNSFFNGSDTINIITNIKKLIHFKNPKYLIMNNVISLCNKIHVKHLNKWINFLNDEGYTTYVDVLNLSNFGIPHNRKTLFVISVPKGEYFSFPYNSILCNEKVALKDYIELKQVEEQYYVVRNFKDYDNTVEYDILHKNADNTCPYIRPTYYKYGISNFCRKENDGFVEPCVIESNKENLSNIRRFKPFESFRFIGLKDNDIKQLIDANILSDKILYELAGNSVPIPIMSSIYNKLFKNE